MKGLRVLEDQTVTSGTRKSINLKKLMKVLSGKDMEEYNKFKEEFLDDGV